MAKSKYETHVQPYLDRIKIWVSKGATQVEIAEKLGISMTALKHWKGRYEPFKTALEAPQGDVDDLVEAALLKRCMGYDYEEVTRWQTIGRGGELIWLEKRSTKHLPPDPSSIQFWLANRRRKEWQRVPEPKVEEQENESGVVMMPEVEEEGR